MKSFKAKDGSGKPPEDGARIPTVDFKGEKRSNDTHASTTDRQARLYKKAEGEKSRLCYLGHTLMENRNGLAVDLETMLATGTAEREAAKRWWCARSNGARPWVPTKITTWPSSSGPCATKA
jgi:hypothetical protein